MAPGLTKTPYSNFGDLQYGRLPFCDKSMEEAGMPLDWMSGPAIGLDTSKSRGIRALPHPDAKILK